MSLTPRTRPDNLVIVKDLPDELPFPIPSNPSDPSILAWCEATRDHFEKEGKLLTVLGLKKLLDKSGMNSDHKGEMKTQINRLFADELAAAKAAQETPAEKPKPATKPAAKEVAASAPTKPPKPAKKGKKVSTATAVKAKPSANGKPSGKKKTLTKVVRKGNPNKPKAAPAQSEVTYNKVVGGIPIKVEDYDNGKRRVKVADIPLRGLMRAMGAAGFVSGDAKQVLSKLFAKVEGGPEYIGEVLAEGHVGSGRMKDAGCFGKVPAVPTTVMKTLKSMRAALN